jgi:hypothetical protein
VSVGENVVGPKPGQVVPEPLAYTGVASTTLPWWALTAFLMGLLFLAYSLRARHLIESLDYVGEPTQERTPWEILATPIRVHGIDYVPESQSDAPATQTLSESLHELDSAISRMLVSRMDQVHAAFSKH